MNGETSVEKKSVGHRVASNTVLLFLRMFILTLINLYAVRLQVRGLGDEDYGIFTAIAGVVMTASVFNSVLAVALQRFFSFSMGRNEESKLQDIYSCSINLVIYATVVILLLLETIGLWLVYTKLSIPEPRFSTALVVYQVSVVMLILSFFHVPFMSAVFAHEDMGVYTLLSTIECLLKFIAAYVIGNVLVDRLALYSFCMMGTSLIVFIMYFAVAYHRYPECRYRKPRDKKLYRELLSFAGWSLLGTVANMCIIQGNTLLLNIFFGSIVTAAFGISINIYNAFNSLCNSMVLAFRPPMIKAYADRQYDNLYTLFCASNKFLIYMLVAIAIPIVGEMDTILSLWLGTYSPETLTFARLTILYIIIIAIHNPITIIIQATGHIKRYHLTVETFTLLCLPLTWLFFRAGYLAESAFYSMVITCVFAHFIRIILLRKEFSAFSISQYFLSIIFPASIVAVISGATFLLTIYKFEPSVFRMLSSFAFIPMLTLSFAYLGGTTAHEKTIIREMAARLFSKVKRSVSHK